MQIVVKEFYRNTLTRTIGNYSQLGYNLFLFQIKFSDVRLLE